MQFRTNLNLVAAALAVLSSMASGEAFDCPDRPTRVTPAGHWNCATDACKSTSGCSKRESACSQNCGCVIGSGSLVNALRSKLAGLGSRPCGKSRYSVSQKGSVTRKGCAVQKTPVRRKCRPARDCHVVQKCRPAPKSCAAQKSCGCGSSCGMNLLDAMSGFFDGCAGKCACPPACAPKLASKSKCNDGGPPSSLPLPDMVPDGPEDDFEDEAEPPTPTLDDGAGVGTGAARTARSLRASRGTWRPAFVPRFPDPTFAPQPSQPRNISRILR